MKPLRTLQALLVAVAAAVPLALVPTAHAANTYYVDRSDPNCNDLGPGGAAQPFCTIKPAAKAAGPGDTVNVKPGTYREEVNPVNSGTAAARITYKASGAGAVIMGSSNLSDSGWSAASGNTWKHAYGNTPTQVFLDGSRLTKGSDAGSLGTNQWFYDRAAKVLYVDIGGPDPSVGHEVEAGARTYGFDLTGRSNITVDGFQIRYQNGSGVHMSSSVKDTVRGNVISMTGTYGVDVTSSSTSKITISLNQISGAASHGIKLKNSSGVQVVNNTSHDNLFSGIQLTGSTDNLISKNKVYGNARPGVRAGVGIDVNGASTGNRLQYNQAYQNQDSGIQVYNGSNNATIVRNVIYQNGDHGIDINSSNGVKVVSDSISGNTTDGISVEGASSPTSIADTISVNNGVWDLYVAKDGSQTSYSSDYDIFWNAAASPNPIKFSGMEFASTADFAAVTPYEDHGITADPKFVGPTNLHLLSGSPAIDSADSGTPGFVARDPGGLSPFDDPATANTGAGSPPYADRGVYEYHT